jgi:hypothetical protein
MKNEVINTLPAEVAAIAQNVSIEKRNEVQAVLNHVFNGVAKMREQLDTIKVVDENDKMSMNIARQVRLAVRNERLSAEKTFDMKRTEVQQAMLSFKTEDSLWLKAKQTMQILTKEIESQAEYLEKTAERAEAERKELKMQLRLIEVQMFAPEIQRHEIEGMSDQVFETFLSGIEKAYNDKIEAEKAAELARIETEKKAAKHAERESQARGLGSFFEWSKSNIDVSDEDWNQLLKEAEIRQTAHEAEQEKIKAENKRLQASADAKEKELEVERKKAAAEASERERLAAIERKKQADIQAENDRKIKEANEAKAKAEAELKAQAAEKAAAEKAAAETAKKAAAAPDKEKIKASIEALVYNTPECKSIEMQQIANDISAKFEAFKKWSFSQTEKI